MHLCIIPRKTCSTTNNTNAHSPEHKSPLDHKLCVIKLQSISMGFLIAFSLTRRCSFPYIYTNLPVRKYRDHATQFYFKWPLWGGLRNSDRKYNVTLRDETFGAISRLNQLENGRGPTFFITSYIEVLECLNSVYLIYIFGHFGSVVNT